jgi:hypothetical protein
MKAINRKPSRKRPPPDRIKSKHKATGRAGQRTSVRLDRRARDAIIRLAEAVRRDNEPSEPHYLKTYASDPIPENAIGLSDAFNRIMDAAEKDPKRLKLDDDDRKEIRTGTESDLKQFIPEDYSPKDIDEISLGKEVNLFLRKCIKEAQLVAYVRDPETGDILQLQRQGWDDLEFHPGELGWLLDNHVHPDDPLNPGPPDVMVRGKARPVFFLRDEFENWFQKTFVGTTAKRGGRKLGSGSWKKADEPLIEEMRKLIQSGSAKSAEDAAGKCAERAMGSGTPESKSTRLAKLYRKQFPSEHN